MNIFNEQINNLHDWNKVYQSIPTFMPIIEYIIKKEKLPFAKVEPLAHGINAVFKIGSYVIKIFAPSEIGIDQKLDLQTELFATKRMAILGIPVPKIIVNGFVDSRYHFDYMITEYINGVKFTEALKTITIYEKVEIAKKLRTLTDKMNIVCDPFNNIDVINDKGRYNRWKKYPETFKMERSSYIKTKYFGERVFVHGDLHGGNILISPKWKLYIIDFADAVLAPKVYEHALVAVKLFGLDPVLLNGYFGNYIKDELVDLCFDGLLIHDLGGDIVEKYISKPDEILSLDTLKTKLKNIIFTHLR